MGTIRLLLFAKCVLWAPGRGGRKKRILISSLIKSRLIRWAANDLGTLWQEVADAMSVKRKTYMHASHKANLKISMRFAREGRYGKAIRALYSRYCFPW